MKLLIYSSFVLLIASCSGTDPSGIEKETFHEEEVKEEIPVALVWKKNAIDSLELARIDQQKNMLQGPYSFLKSWNSSMNIGNRNSLLRYYNEPLQFRGQEYHPPGVVGNISGLNFLVSGYHQEITELMVAFPSSSHRNIICNLKIQVSAQKYPSDHLFEIRKTAGQFAIHKVSSNIMEMLRSSDQPSKNNYSEDGMSFVYDYWTQNMEGEDVNFIPNYLVLDILPNDTLLRWFDGATSQITIFDIKDFKMTESGSLDFKAASTKYENEEIAEEKYQPFAFKRLKNGLLFTRHDGDFEDLVGIKMWKVN